MAPSWTAGPWTLLAALGLLCFFSFGSCKASGTSSSTSAGRREDQGPSSRERVKRGWVWNQFFVVEEYTGTEPLYVGKVSHSFVFIHDVFLKLIKGNFTNLDIWEIQQKIQHIDFNQPRCSPKYCDLFET